MPCAVILTALPIEYLAVCNHLRDIQEEVNPQGNIYERGRFIANRQEWKESVSSKTASNLKKFAQ